MADLKGRPRSRYVRGMFSRIADRYDRLNHIMTLGQDRAWRRQAIKHLKLKPTDRLLDIGAGTGDLSYEAIRQQPAVSVIAADFTADMIRIGRQRAEGDEPSWVIADTEQLPFASTAFDGVVSGFLLRNVGDLPQALHEQNRVLKPGGRWVALETTPPPLNLLRPFLQFYLRWIIPALGRWLAGDPEAYRYLPNSTEAFLGPGPMSDALRKAGLTEVGYQPKMMGTVAIYWGERPPSADKQPPMVD